MKECIICKISKEIDEFYKHKQMSDGHLNKCKQCCKDQAKIRQNILIQDPKWRESEKERAREKYHRLEYKNKKPSSDKKREIIKKYSNKYPEKLLARKALPRIKEKCEFERHHWSYNEENWKDIIKLSIKDHNLLHRNMIYDPEKMMYRNRKGELLDSKQSHIDLLNLLYENVKDNILR